MLSRPSSALCCLDWCLRVFDLPEPVDLLGRDSSLGDDCINISAAHSLRRPSKLSELQVASSGINLVKSGLAWSSVGGSSVLESRGVTVSICSVSGVTVRVRGAEVSGVMGRGVGEVGDSVVGDSRVGVS